MSNIFEIIDNLGLSKKDSYKLQVYLITRGEERTELYSALTSPNKTDEDRLRLLEEFLMTITAESSESSKRQKRWRTYIASDNKHVEVPPKIFDMLCNNDFVPDPRVKFAKTLKDLKPGVSIEMPRLGQSPKHFAQGYYGEKFFVTGQMLEIWEKFSRDQQNSIKCVLSGPMGVGKSYLAMFLAAKAFSEKWLVLYVADAAKLDLSSEDQTSEVIARYFLAMNRDILTAAELENLVGKIRTDYLVPFVEAMWEMFEQKHRKTLVVVDEHGVLFSHETPAPLRLHILKPLMILTYWSEDSLGTRVVLTGTAHAKFEKKYLINGMNDWVEFVGPFPEDIFDNLLKLHPILGNERIVSKVKEVTNCVPRELIYLHKHIRHLNSISDISDDKVDELLEHFRGNRHSELLNIARNHFETLDIGKKIDYRKNLSVMFLKSSYVKQNVSFDWKFLDTGLVYRFKDVYDFVLFKPLCPAALDALLDVYKDFPLPRDVSVTSLSNGQLNAYNFEEILFQQMLKHSDILLKATDLAGKPTTDVHIKFEHFILLDKDQLAPNPQHSKFLVRGYERYPRFDFIIGYTFIQVSVNSFDQHNKGSANISKAFECYHKDGSDLRNQIEIYLDTVFGGQHTVMLVNGKFNVLKNGLPVVPDFRIVYMRGNPGSPNHTQLVKKYQDIAFISYDEVKTKLFGDFLHS